MCLKKCAMAEVYIYTGNMGEREMRKNSILSEMVRKTPLLMQRGSAVYQQWRRNQTEQDYISGRQTKR